RQIPVTFTLTPIGPGSSLKQTVMTIANPPGSGARATAMFTDVAVNVYDVSIEVGGDFYQGNAESALVVFDPSLVLTNGGGQITHNGSKANFGFYFNYLNNGRVQGSLLYIEHAAAGNMKLKSNAIESMAIIGNQAIVLGKVNFNGGGNYNFQLIAVDS